MPEHEKEVNMADFVIRDNDRICSICIAEEATLTTMTAAGELARYLTRQSGLTPVVLSSIVMWWPAGLL